MLADHERLRRRNSSATRTGSLHGADIDGPQAERIGGDDGVLSGEGRIDAATMKVSSHGSASKVDLLGLAHALVARQVRDPAEIERTLLDVLLIAGDGGPAPCASPDR